MEKTKINLKKIALPLLFLFVLGFPFLNLLLFHIPEKHNPLFHYAEKPEPDIENLDPFPQQCDNYINENYILKHLILQSNVYFKLKILNVSPNQDKVIVGKNNWLFSSEKVLMDYRATSLLTEAEKEKLKTILHTRGEYYNKNGIAFYIAVVPNKHNVYPEYLPSNISRAGETTLKDQLVECVKGDSLIHLIDLHETLLKSKRDHILYYKKDNHWNDLGAFAGYLTIIKGIKEKFPTVNPVSITSYYIDSSKALSGGEALMVDMDDWISEQRIMLKHKTQPKATAGIHHGYKWPEGFEYSSDFEIQRIVNDSSLPSAVIIRDSFSDFMIQFLQESFSKTTFIFDKWEYKTNKRIIETENPDIVIMEIIDSNIRRLLEAEENEL